jgi:crossover junction endodeoxyribonuclease RuvC
MVFLGLDIGFDRCGFAVLAYDSRTRKNEILYAGSILTDKKLSIGERLKILHDDLLFIKQKYEPEYMCIEKLFFNRENSTFEKVCMSKGIAMMLFSDIQTLQVEPNKVKSTIVGNGHAKKPEIRMITEKLLNRSLAKMYDDTIDAICLALYHIEVERVENLKTKK